jgi:hypothetical protein
MESWITCQHLQGSQANHLDFRSSAADIGVDRTVVARDKVGIDLGVSAEKVVVVADTAAD